MLTGGALLTRRSEPRRLPPIPAAGVSRVLSAPESGQKHFAAMENVPPAAPHPVAKPAAEPAPVFVEVKQTAVAKPQEEKKVKAMNTASIKSSIVTAAVATVAFSTATPKTAQAANPVEGVAHSAARLIETRAEDVGKTSARVVETRAEDVKASNARCRVIDTATPLGTVIMLK